MKKIIKEYTNERMVKPYQTMNQWGIIEVFTDVYFAHNDDIRNIKLNGTQNVGSIFKYLNTLTEHTIDSCLEKTEKDFFLENIYLISGYRDIIDQDIFMNQGSGKLLINFRKFCLHLIEKGIVDLIFIDMNPGNSAMNQFALLSCDKIITPIGNDPFSMASLISLPDILQKCYNTYKEEILKNRNQYRKLFNNPKFNFVVDVNYRKTTKGGLETHMLDKLINYLQQLKNRVNIEGYNDYITDRNKIKEQVEITCKESDISYSEVCTQVGIESSGFRYMMLIMKQIIKKIKIIRPNCFSKHFRIIAKIPSFNQYIVLIHRFGLVYKEINSWCNKLGVSEYDHDMVVEEETDKIITRIWKNHKYNFQEKEDNEKYNAWKKDKNKLKRIRVQSITNDDEE